MARLQTARVRVVETAEGVRQAIESADKNFIGLRETARPAGELLRLIIRPQEVVAAIIALETAYEQYAPAVNEYNTAQFDLYRALGQPAQWVTSLQWQPPEPPSDRGPAGPTPPPRRVRPHRARHRPDVGVSPRRTHALRPRESRCVRTGAPSAKVRPLIRRSAPESIPRPAGRI